MIPGITFSIAIGIIIIFMINVTWMCYYIKDDRIASTIGTIFLIVIFILSVWWVGWRDIKTDKEFNVIETKYHYIIKIGDTIKHYKKKIFRKMTTNNIIIYQNKTLSGRLLNSYFIKFKK